MKKVIDWLKGLFKDEKGSPSSKRFVGIFCSLTLCITLYVNSLTEEHYKPSEALVYSVASLALGCLGLSSVDKWSDKKKETKIKE